MKLFKTFWKDERGLETAEWALLLGIVVLAGTMAAVAARPHIVSIFTEMQEELATADTYGT